MKRIMLLSSGIVHPSIRDRRCCYLLLKGITDILIDRRISVKAVRNLNKNYNALFLYIHK